MLSAEGTLYIGSGSDSLVFLIVRISFSNGLGSDALPFSGRHDIHGPNPSHDQADAPKKGIKKHHKYPENRSQDLARNLTARKVNKNCINPNKVNNYALLIYLKKELNPKKLKVAPLEAASLLGWNRSDPKPYINGLGNNKNRGSDLHNMHEYPECRDTLTRKRVHTPADTPNLAKLYGPNLK